MLTWLDWYVRRRIQAPESAEDILRHMRAGATNPMMALAEECADLLAEFTVDREGFARKVGNRKVAEDLGVRLGLMSPFISGFARPETRAVVLPSPPLGLLLTRETAALLGDADPPGDDWRNLTFGSGPGQDRRTGVYVDVPHSALLVGSGLQVRAIFAIPMMVDDGAGGLRWDGGVLVHGLVTTTGSEHESGSVFAVVLPDEGMTLLALDPDTVMGGIDMGDGAATGSPEWVAVYHRVMENSVRFLRMALAYHRYGPPDARQAVGRTSPERAATNNSRPKKGESLFAVTRLTASADRMGRPPATGAGGWNLAARQEVAGHFKLQPHGPGGSLRKMIWVQAYGRGPEDGPVKPKAVRL